MARGKTVTQTFRINLETQNSLLVEAENKRVSLNTLVSNLLEDYVVFGRHAETWRVLKLGPSVMTSILGQISEDAVRQVGSELGHRHPAEVLAALGRNLTVENFLNLVEDILCRHAHWFDSCAIEKGDAWKVHLRHSLGRKWSIYLSEYVSGMFEELGFRKMEPTVVDQFYTTVHLQPIPAYSARKGEEVPFPLRLDMAKVERRNG